jgi:hypothetical protein
MKMNHSLYPANHSTLTGARLYVSHYVYPLRMASDLGLIGHLGQITGSICR